MNFSMQWKITGKIVNFPGKDTGKPQVLEGGKGQQSQTKPSSATPTGRKAREPLRTETGIRNLTAHVGSAVDN